MTNKEKALELIDVKTEKSLSTGWLISNSDAIRAVELASKPDWFHPNKGEFPNDGELILEVSNTIGDDIPDSHQYYDEDKTLFLEECKAWCYLPTYKQN